MERTVESLNNEEYELLLKAMETHEGWIEGFEEFKEVEKITATRMNRKRVISEYLVRGMNSECWLLKDVAIAMAEEGCLYAIVVHAKKGSYLPAQIWLQVFQTATLFDLMILAPREHTISEQVIQFGRWFWVVRRAWLMDTS